MQCMDKRRYGELSRISEKCDLYFFRMVNARVFLFFLIIPWLYLLHIVHQCGVDVANSDNNELEPKPNCVKFLLADH